MRVGRSGTAHSGPLLPNPHSRAVRSQRKSPQALRRGVHGAIHGVPIGGGSNEPAYVHSLTAKHELAFKRLGKRLIRADEPKIAPPLSPMSELDVGAIAPQCLR